MGHLQPFYLRNDDVWTGLVVPLSVHDGAQLVQPNVHTTNVTLSKKYHTETHDMGEIVEIKPLLCSEDISYLPYKMLSHKTMIRLLCNYHAVCCYYKNYVLFLAAHALYRTKHCIWAIFERHFHSTMKN